MNIVFELSTVSCPCLPCVPSHCSAVPEAASSSWPSNSSSSWWENNSSITFRSSLSRMFSLYNQLFGFGCFYYFLLLITFIVTFWSYAEAWEPSQTLKLYICKKIQLILTLQNKLKREILDFWTATVVLNIWMSSIWRPEVRRIEHEQIAFRLFSFVFCSWKVPSFWDQVTDLGLKECSIWLRSS